MAGIAGRGTRSRALGWRSLRGGHLWGEVPGVHAPGRQEGGSWPAQTRNTFGVPRYAKSKPHSGEAVRRGAKNPSIKALSTVVTSLTFRRTRPRSGADSGENNLRQLRVQLNDPAHIASLLEFLRARDCVVEQIDTAVLAVWCPPCERDGPGGMTCRSCGSPVAETLGRLGSLRCHDCRDTGGFETLLAGIYGHANSNGRVEQARSDLTAYLAQWHATCPGAAATID
jgi:hypothetical protein